MLGKVFNTLFLTFILTIWTASMTVAQEPQVNAVAAVLMDAQTGAVLFAKNSDFRRPPASTTKIITGIIALESGDPSRIVSVSRNAAEKEGSSVWLLPGEKQRLIDLVYGLMLGSGNDAAAAIAEHISGSEQEFAKLMTEKARQLGAENTRFQNPSGLPDPGHYTTAYDLAKITCYALQNPEFAKVVQTKSFLLPGNELQKERQIFNHNRLLWRYANADGVKTGYTRAAGKCLVSSASKDGRRLVAVVFNSKTIYEDCQALLDYGFEGFRLVSLNNEGFRESVPVKVGVEPMVEAIPGRPIKAVIPAEDMGKIRVKTVLKENLEAPIVRMQNLGEVKLFMGEKMIDKVPLLATADVPRNTFFYKFVNWFKHLFRIGTGT
jgi:D-alanyl-D-alanine carboxypeptidase (penicillin-binding protein 5/6)